MAGSNPLMFSLLLTVGCHCFIISSLFFRFRLYLRLSLYLRLYPRLYRRLLTGFRRLRARRGPLRFLRRATLLLRSHHGLQRLLQGLQGMAEADC